jgi:hypothetical protein
MIFLRQVFESLVFAYQALRSNLLRTTLSLLGVSVGIFAIVAVFTAVDSLKGKIRNGKYTHKGTYSDRSLARWLSFLLSLMSSVDGCFAKPFC